MTEIGTTKGTGTSVETRHSRLTSPALFLALAFALGIALAGSGHSSLGELSRVIPVLFIAGALCLLGGAVFVQAGRDGFAVVATLAGFVLAGAAASILFSFRFPPDHISHLENWGINLERTVRVRGTLKSDRIVTPAGDEFDLEVAALSSGESDLHRASGRIRVQVGASRAGASSDSAMYELHSGDHVEATMRLRRPHVSLNPGSFDFRERAANIDDLFWEGAIENPSQLHRFSGGPTPAPERAIEGARSRLRRAIDRLYPPWSAEGRDGAVLKAILLGDRTSLNSTTIDHFRASGLYHLLVIAGLHVGLIAALILGLLRLLRLSRAWRNLILLIVLVAYAFVVEQRAPTLRATLMLVIYLVAQFLDRDHSALNAVGLAALALLLTRPAWLFESGFQLSFAAALLIVGLAVPVLRMSLEPYRNALGHLEDVERDTALRPRQAQFRLDLRMLVSSLQRHLTLLTHRPGVAARVVVWPLRLSLWIAGMVLFSAVLQVGLLMPMVEQFHRVTLAGVGLNALALPLMGVLLGVALPTVLLATIAPSAAVWPAKALTLVFHALFAVAEQPHLPAWLSFRVPSPPVWVAVGLAVSLVALAVSLGRSRLASIGSLLAFTILALTLASAPFPPHLQSGVFEVTALDCGGGEAALLALPDRNTVLVGACGSGRARSEFAAKRWDGGENIVSPYLWSRRMKALDVVVVTSVAGNLDGFVSILQNFRVGEIWFRDTDAGVASILEEATRRHVTIRAISAGESLRVGSTVFEILAVPGEATRGSSAGAEPLVVRVTGGDTTALIGSSITTHGQEQIAASNPSVDTLILATGRRTLVWATGSNSSQAAPLPVANPDPNPNPRTVDSDDLKASSPLEAGDRLFATDRDGAITAEMKGRVLRIRTFRESASHDLKRGAGESNP